ncbi:uncharacterized protein LOC105380961 [Plutella xylostella]|uniref:uncharacterized protein LOC105380961 n=1 Tax=Plutella xylostella TaxID=51655 RepID=UPI0020329D40|nr:uncharacterized protein LOC105380961 [Plutella xylostella]
MLWSSVFVFVLAFANSFSKTVVPDFITPCEVKDKKCIGEGWTQAVQNLATGSSEINLPILDPLRLEGIDIDIPGTVHLKFNGTLKGLKGCIFDKVGVDFSKGSVSQVLDLRCNITIKGNYNVDVNSSSLFGGIGGNGIEGLIKADGVGKVKLEKLKLKMMLDLNLVRDDDKEVKMVLKDGPVGYKYKIGGPVVFQGNNIYVADQDISALVIGFMNSNWQVVMNVFGGYFFDDAMLRIGDFIREFYKVVPPRALFTDNLDEFYP